MNERDEEFSSMAGLVTAMLIGAVMTLSAGLLWVTL